MIATHAATSSTSAIIQLEDAGSFGRICSRYGCLFSVLWSPLGRACQTVPGICGSGATLVVQGFRSTSHKALGELHKVNLLSTTTVTVLLALSLDAGPYGWMQCHPTAQSRPAAHLARRHLPVTLKTEIMLLNGDT
jgi:hypothetical protein